MVSERPYRRPISTEKALKKMEEEKNPAVGPHTP